MASGPITAWQKEGERVEVVTGFLFLGFRITVDADCSHEIRRWLLLGEKAVTDLDSMLKSRHITLPTKVCITVKAMVFPVVTHGCETLIIKKAERQRIDAFDLWCWRRLPRVPWTARSNQSILREINTESFHWKDWCWSSSILVIWCEQTTHWKSPWWWERWRAEGEGAIKGWDGWMTSRTQQAWVWASSGRWWKTGKPGMLQSMGSERVGHDWVTEQQLL